MTFVCFLIRKTFTVMHTAVLEHSDTLSLALLACIILYINGKQFRCSVFIFVQYIDAYTKFGQNLSIISKDSKLKRNSDIYQGQISKK